MKEIGRRAMMILITLVAIPIAVCLYATTAIRDIVVQGNLNGGWTDKVSTWVESL